jgi:hypothetical protein
LGTTQKEKEKEKRRKERYHSGVGITKKQKHTAAVSGQRVLFPFTTLLAF